MTDPSRSFPAPWQADKTPRGYVVRDANGQLARQHCRGAASKDADKRRSTADRGERRAIADCLF